MSEKRIDPKTDLDWTLAKPAQKIAEVQAVFVPAGTVVETVMANGLVETTKTAGADGGYKITNPAGEEYVMNPDKFKERYEAAERDGYFKPVWAPVMVVQIDEDVVFTAPWGNDMHIAAGGVIVNNNGDIYGIQPAEFADTYRYLETSEPC